MYNIFMADKTVGRPKRGFMVEQINFTAPKNIAEQIKRIAENHKWSKSQTTLELIKIGLKNQKGL